MKQDVVQHKVTDIAPNKVQVSSKITQRKIGQIMREVQKKLT